MRIDKIENGFIISDYENGKTTYCKNLAQVVKFLKAHLQPKDQIPF